MSSQRTIYLLACHSYVLPYLRNTGGPSTQAWHLFSAKRGRALDDTGSAWVSRVVSGDLRWTAASPQSLWPPPSFLGNCSPRATICQIRKFNGAHTSHLLRKRKKGRRSCISSFTSLVSYRVWVHNLNFFCVSLQLSGPQSSGRRPVSRLLPGEYNLSSPARSTGTLLLPHLLHLAFLHLASLLLVSCGSR
jgi:hypothetical protein